MNQSMIDTTVPLVELHRHLDGNVRLETILKLGQKHNLTLPADDLESLRPFVQVTEAKPDILSYFAKFEWLVRVMVDYDAVHQIAYENVEDAKNEGIDYIELRFSPWFMSEKNHLDPVGVVEAVIDGVKIGSRDFGVRTNLIGILSRTYGPEICKKELQALLTHKTDIVALDLAGDEIHFGEIYLWIISALRGMPAGIPTLMRVKSVDHPVYGKPSMNWVQSASVTPSML